MLDLATQRTVPFWDALHRRGNQFIEHELAGKPPLLHFDYELVLDGRGFERPVNYALVCITPPPDVTVDDKQLEILERIKATLGQQAAA